MYKYFSYKHASTFLKGAGGLHQDFLEIDFLVVPDRED